MEHLITLLRDIYKDYPKAFFATLVGLVIIFGLGYYSLEELKIRSELRAQLQTQEHKQEVQQVIPQKLPTEVKKVIRERLPVQDQLILKR